MYGGDTHQRPPQGPPTPPHHQFQQHPPPHDFPRGPFPPPGPPPPHLMRQPSASSTTNAPPHEFHHHQQHQQQHPYHMHQHQQQPYDSHADSYAVKRLRKIGQRRAVDYTSTVVQYMQIRMFQQDSSDRTMLQPTPAAAIDLLPPAAYVDNPSASFAAKFVHTSLNKNRCSINRVVWTPSGRRLITGSQSGEFTLWNGQSFNFEMILQAHEQAVRSMVWSYNENWMVTGDDSGSIKYWQNNMNNVKANKSAHKESVRGLSFCRTDLKFCSCSDDTTVKVWDFARCQEERSLSGNVLQAGHGWDVKCVDWHPTKSLLVSGGKDNLVKLWDAKSGRELCSFHGHKNNVLCVKWNENGNWVLTASKDQIIKLYDIRAMKELQSFRGHRKDVTALAWHPFHEEYFVSGSFDGSIFHWLVGHETPQVEIQNAHDSSVWDLAWHPIGYLLCSGGNDHATKFWCRNRPGDPAVDKLPPGPNQGFGEQAPAMGGRMPIPFPMPEPHTIPGGPFGNLTRNEGTIPGIGAAMPLSVPSLDSSDQKPAQSGSMPLGPPPLPPGPHPSLLAGNAPQPYQQNAPPSLQQHQSMLMPPQQPNMPPHMQPPSHMPMLQQHHNLPRPPPQLQPHNVESSMPGGPMGGSMAQGGPYMGGGGGPSNPASGQMYHQPAGGFSRPPPGQMQMIPGINPYQSGNPNAPNMPSNYNHPSLPHRHAHQ